MNPAAWYDPDTHEVKLIYRAAGHDEEHYVHLGLATSRDGYHFQRTSVQPVFSPSSDGFDAGCIEDPRIVKMGDYYYITYAARPFSPHQYWKPECFGAMLLDLKDPAKVLHRARPPRAI